MFSLYAVVCKINVLYKVYPIDIGGEDFTGRVITGQFMPLSDLTRICYNIAIAFDSIIEQTERFSVDFVIETSLPNDVRERVTVANAVTNIIIEDSS